ncbi:MAG: Smr/MutS family protein [Treponema sp.]|jgi:DNA-nicking Smr family endonuclease|nr:Smr/MutS family protein [Treponema sp.]
MNFGDILDEWDRQTAKTAGKKGAARPGVQAVEKRNPLDAWLMRNGVYDKDAEEGESRPCTGGRRRRLLHKKPDAVIDLHGLTQDEAWAALERFFENSRLGNCEKLLIIHGKGIHSAGEAVLSKVSRKFIEACPFAGESGRGSAAEGGGGATWVLLKELK